MFFHVVLEGVDFVNRDAMDYDSVLGPPYFDARVCLHPVYLTETFCFIFGSASDPYIAAFEFLHTEDRGRWLCSVVVLFDCCLETVCDSHVVVPLDLISRFLMSFRREGDLELGPLEAPFGLFLLALLVVISPAGVSAVGSRGCFWCRCNRCPAAFCCFFRGFYRLLDVLELTLYARHFIFDCMDRFHELNYSSKWAITSSLTSPGPRGFFGSTACFAHV